jgi:hypothetical protein
MERRLLKRYAPLMVPAPGDRLFIEGPASFAYYDVETLEKDSRVCGLLDDLSRKFRPSGMRMRFANAARGALVTWRRLTNRFR